MENVYGWFFRLVGSSISSFIIYTFFREFFTKPTAQLTIDAMISGPGFITGICTCLLTLAFMYIGKDH